MDFLLRLSKILPKFLSDLLSRFITDKVFDRYALSIWRKKAIEVAQINNIIEEKFAKEIAKSNAMARLYYSMFYFSKGIPKIEDLVVVIAMEAIDIQCSLDKKHIIQYANAIVDYWTEEILENEILKKRLEKKTGVNIYSLRERTVDYNHLLKRIESPENIRKEFFRSYSSLQLNDSIVRVILPNDKGYVDYRSSSYVDVRVNPFLGFELGFFKIGYDYILLDNNRFLTSVTYSKNRKREAASFGNQFIGQATKYLIWLR